MTSVEEVAGGPGSPQPYEIERFLTAAVIVLGLALYYLAQPARWRLLSEGLRRGAQSNRERMRRLDEPAWASLLAFLNAPFGF